MTKILVISNNISVKLKVYIDNNRIKIIEKKDFYTKGNLYQDFHYLLFIHDIYTDELIDFNDIIKLKDSCLEKKINNIILCLSPKMLYTNLKEINDWKINKILIYKPFIWDYFYEYKIFNIRNNILYTNSNIDTFNFVGLSEKDFLNVIVGILTNIHTHTKIYKIGQLFQLCDLEKYMQVSRKLDNIDSNAKMNYYKLTPEKEDFLAQTKKIYPNTLNIINWLKNNYYNLNY